MEVNSAQAGQSVHGLGVPGVGGNVVKGLGDGDILVQQQVVEHLGHLGAGHVVLRAEGPFGIAEQVLDVVVGVQQVRHAAVVRVHRGDVGRVVAAARARRGRGVGCGIGVGRGLCGGVLARYLVEHHAVIVNGPFTVCVFQGEHLIRLVGGEAMLFVGVLVVDVYIVLHIYNGDVAKIAATYFFHFADFIRARNQVESLLLVAGVLRYTGQDHRLVAVKDVVNCLIVGFLGQGGFFAVAD